MSTAVRLTMWKISRNVPLNQNSSRAIRQRMHGVRLGKLGVVQHGWRSVRKEGACPPTLWKPLLLQAALYFLLTVKLTVCFCSSLHFVSEIVWLLIRVHVWCFVTRKQSHDLTTRPDQAKLLRGCIIRHDYSNECTYRVIQIINKLSF